MQEPSVKERIKRERAALGIVDADADEGEGTSVKAKAVAALKRSPEDLARMDYEKIVKAKSGDLLGTEPGRWRLLHVLYMRRLKEQRENIAKLEAEAAEDGDGSKSGDVSGGEMVAEAERESAVAEEIRKIDEALDEEEKMPDDEDEDDIVDANGNIISDKEKRSMSQPPSSADVENAAESKDTDASSKPWSQKRTSQSKGRLEVHPDVLEAAERGEQPRSSL